MKDKKEQINEMAKIMQKCYEKNGVLNFKWFAESAYKCLTEDSVILSKGAYESLLSKAKQNVVNAVEICRETIEKDFNSIIQALEERKDRVKAFYSVNESVGVDIAIRTVKELAKQYGVEVKE